VRPDLFDILRCPYCGGSLELDTSVPAVSRGDEILDGMIGCACCTFPVVAGIPVMHLEEPVRSVSEHVRAGRHDLARRAMLNLGNERAAAFEAIVTSDAATCADALRTLGPDDESRYFLYRFSDPSYVVAHAIVRAVAGTVLREGTGGRAVDICGGSGHLTRALMDLSSPPPVVADLYFWKLRLAQFTAPGCEAVCCTANSPLPFARGAFRYAMCADAFMFIWTKRLLVGEMLRLIDVEDRHGAVVISHAHNQLVWSQSHGQPLSPSGYRDLFETIEPRLFSEAGLLADFVTGGPLNLGRHDSVATLDQDAALTMVASRHPAVFRAHALDRAPGAPGDLSVNPLYAVEHEGNRVRLRLQFPSAAYEEEFGHCREYLPEVALVDQASLAALREGRLPAELDDLVRRRVILDLPKRYVTVSSNSSGPTETRRPAR
jgi:uncharacterized protein YbaR (Trm112 family)